MALRDLQTNLKSLQFGNDTPGGGSSGLPYIKTGLPEDSPAGEYLAGIARNSMDWPLRGGAYSTIASTTDSVRISRFLTDLPRGYVFTSKQVQLQKSNPKIETGGLSSRLNTQTYNLNANLLAQVFEQGTGIHIPRPGANANELGPDNPQAKYEYIVSHKNTDQNRLVALYGSKIQQNSTGLSLDSAVTKLGISTDDNILFDYEMGPDSLYGDGNTTIFRTTNTTTAFEGYISNGFIKTGYNPLFKTLSQDTPYNSSYIASLYNTSNVDAFIQSSIVAQPFGIPSNAQIVNLVRDEFNSEDNTSYQQSSPDYIRPEFVPIGTSFINYFGNTMGYSALLASRKDNDISAPPKLQDFRKYTIDNNPLAEDYTDFYIPMITRIGIGSPGARPYVSRSNYYDPFLGGQDKVNMSPIYRSSIDNRIEKDSDDVRDLIKFCIEVIDNDSPSVTDRMHFRAFITNFSDNIGAEWDSKKYMGRGENFYTYQGFTREVGFTFIVAAQSVQEMEKIYQKTNYLASTLLPDYQLGSGFMRGNLHKLTIGEYFYRVPGIITSMNISVEDNYAWEIKMKQPELRKINNDEGVALDQLQMEVPQILKIQMNFKPIMDKLPQKGLKEPVIVSETIANNYLIRKDFDYRYKLAKVPPPPDPVNPEEIPSELN
jgi:hypothetical protein